MRVLLFLVLSTAALAQHVVRGPVVGAVTDAGARFTLQLNAEVPVSLELSTSADFNAKPIKSSTATARKGDRYFVTLSVSWLAPSTRYYIRPVVNGKPLKAPVTSFKTFPKRGTDAEYAFTFGSCTRYDKNMRPSNVFKLMEGDNPLFFLHIGDWDYPDYELSSRFTDHDSMIAKAYERKYRTGAGLDTFLQTTAVDYVYDDHDYIGNNSDGSGRTRENAIAGYQKYFPHYTLPNAQGGIWHKFTAGNVDIFMLDVRSARSVDTNAYQRKNGAYIWKAKPGQSMLRAVRKGKEDQYAWLLRELKASKARWKFVMSGVNWNPAMRRQLPLALAQANATKSSSVLRKISDTWLGFTEEQDSIIAYIKRQKIANVIVCSGDVHTAMLDDGANSVFPEIVSANLQNYNSNVYGVLKSVGLDDIWNRGGQVKDSLNTYGRITIKTKPKHAALLEIVDERGKIVASYEVQDSSVADRRVAKRPKVKEVSLRLMSKGRRESIYRLELIDKEFVQAYIIDATGERVAEVLSGELPAGGTNFPVRKTQLPEGRFRVAVEVRGSQFVEPLE